jgi:ribulose-phosphate 3-epimerase
VIVAAARPATTLPFDVHLMIERPDAYVAEFRKAGADSNHRPRRGLSPPAPFAAGHPRDRCARVGVSLNPHAPLALIEHVLDDVDLVLLMTVNPGFGGQRFIPNVLPQDPRTPRNDRKAQIED